MLGFASHMQLESSVNDVGVSWIKLFVIIVFIEFFFFALWTGWLKYSNRKSTSDTDYDSQKSVSYAFERAQMIIFKSWSKIES